MRNPRDFFKALAVDAPEPLREIPFKPSRMIHFLDFSNEKMAAKAPDIARQTDILLGNLEDAVPVDRKEAARQGLIDVARSADLGETALWTRVNSLDSPWFLDDMDELVAGAGNRIEVFMLPKVQGAWDITFVDQYLALLEAKHGVQRPILLHAILETALGVTNVEEICAASPRMQGISFGPSDLAASRRMKTTRVGGGHRQIIRGRAKDAHFNADLVRRILCNRRDPPSTNKHRAVIRDAGLARRGHPIDKGRRVLVEARRGRDGHRRIGDGCPGGVITE